MAAIKTPGSGSSAKKSNPFNVFTPTPKVASTAAVADRRSTANITAPAPTQKMYSGPLIDPTSGASGVSAYAAQQAAANSGAQGNGTGQVDYGAATAANPAPATPDTSVETLVKTPEYMARERALQAAMDLFTQSQNTDTTRYNENYTKSLGDLGYDPTNSSWDLGQLMAEGRKATTAGKAYNNLRNDFAARGMLQSGAYQASRGILEGQLKDQLAAIETAKTNFSTDQAAKLAAQQQANEQARAQALADAKAAILNGMTGA
jgi:hypothetical protein